MLSASCMAERATSVGSLIFLGLFAISVHALVLRKPQVRVAAASPVADPSPKPVPGAAIATARCRSLPPTSYWLGVSNEMVVINTILIIVNGWRRRPLARLENHGAVGRNWSLNITEGQFRT